MAKDETPVTMAIRTLRAAGSRHTRTRARNAAGPGTPPPA